MEVSSHGFVMVTGMMTTNKYRLLVDGLPVLANRESTSVPVLQVQLHIAVEHTGAHSGTVARNRDQVTQRDRLLSFWLQLQKTGKPRIPVLMLEYNELVPVHVYVHIGELCTHDEGIVPSIAAAVLLRSKCSPPTCRNRKHWLARAMQKYFP